MASTTPYPPDSKYQEAHGELGGASTVDAPPPYVSSAQGNVVSPLSDEPKPDVPERSSLRPRSADLPELASSTPQGSSTLAPYTDAHDQSRPPLPPRRSFDETNDDPSNPIHYTRDPHKLIGYLVPFPKPDIKGVDPASIPERFLIYTPPPPPLAPPAEGEHETKLHKVQRKWQDEVRQAKASTAKTASWKGVKSKATRGINKGMSLIGSSNLEFLNRIPTGSSPPARDEHHENDGHEGDTTHKTVGLEELVLIYPSSFNATPEQLRLEFVNTMMRSKSKAQRDAVLATGLLPVSLAIDVLATVIWPFGGLFELDSVWAFTTIRGAKTARSVTKRLSSSTSETHPEKEDDSKDNLRLNFTRSRRLEVLTQYLTGKCSDRDYHMFPKHGVMPTETEVLSAIGWAPSQAGKSEKNWEDEQWETEEVKEDLKLTLGKASKEWEKWCKAFAKNPEKALKK